MEANGVGNGLANGVGHGLADHAPANGVGHGLADHALANGVGHGLADHALVNGGGHALANGLANGGDQAPAMEAGGAVGNGGGHGLANGGGHGLANHALANGGGHALANGLANQVPAMEAGGAVGNGGLNHGQVMLAPNGVVPAQALAAANPAFSLVFLYLPAQEIARCRGVCRLWRSVTGSEDFRRRHHEHHCRTPMPLFDIQDPDPLQVNLLAVDIRDRVSRPVLRFTLHPNQVFMIHGSCAGILLLSCNDWLYACNPCTGCYAHLPPIHVNHDVIGVYLTGAYNHANFGCQVLYHDRREPDCIYRIFTLSAAALPPTFLGRPGADEDELGLDLVLANGILPSYIIPPVYVTHFLHWLPQAAQDNINILMFDTHAESFSLIPPPTIQVNGEDVPLVGRNQLFEIDQQLAMTVISPTRVDVWVRNNVTELWNRWYRIRLPVDVINLNDGYHDDGSLTADVFSVAQDRNNLVQCPRILLQCDPLIGAVLQSYQLADHRIFLSRHTIQESLLLYPTILPMW